MKIADIPARFNIPFANSAGGGYIQYPLPEPSQVGIEGGRASLTTGFPPLNFLPVGAGGIPPFGQDMNGILKQITAWSRWQGAGSPVPYNSDFSTSIGGYPKGALIAATSFVGFWISTADDNTSNPETGGANWLPFYPYIRETLSADRTYYVATTGNDTTGDGSVGNPWATVQHAWDYVSSRINVNGYIVTIQMADGTYSAGLSAGTPITGVSSPGSIVLRGNTGTPANVVISTTGGLSNITVFNGASITVRGLTLTNSGGANGCLIAGDRGQINFDTIRFGAAGVAHVYAANYGLVQITGSYSVVGGAGSHYYANVAGLIGALSASTVTLTGTPAFSDAFAYCRISSVINVRTGTLSFSGAATGTRYRAELLGNIYTEGGGASYYPGNSAGTTATSGIYN